MANASIPGLPVATSLDGTEQLEIVQPAGSGGTTKRTTTGAVAALTNIGGSPADSSFILATRNTGLTSSRVLAVDTGDIVYADSGALGTATIGPINTAAITYPKFQQIAALSVLGQSSNVAGIIGAIAGTTDQVMRVSQDGATLGFGQVNLSSISAVTGILAVSFGGTGTSTFTANGVLVGNGASAVKIATANTAGYVLTDNGTGAIPTFQPLIAAQQDGLSVLGVAGNTTATPAAITGTINQVLRVAPNGTALAFGQLNLSSTSAVTGFLATSYIIGTFVTSQVTGIWSVQNGGSGTSSLTAFGVIYGNGTSAVGVTAAGSAGQLLLGQTTTSAPAFKTSTGDITYSAIGTATIATAVVSNAKLATMAAGTFKGNNGTATAAPSDLSTSQAIALLSVGYQYVETLTASTSTSLTSSTFTTAFNDYVFIFDNLVPTSDGVGINATVESGSVFQTTSYLNAAVATTYIDVSTVNTVTNTAGKGLSGVYTLHNVNSTTANKMLEGRGAFVNTSSLIIAAGVSGMWNGGQGSVTRLQVQTTSGTLSTGVVYVLGARHA